MRASTFRLVALEARWPTRLAGLPPMAMTALSSLSRVLLTLPSVSMKGATLPSQQDCSKV